MSEETENQNDGTWSGLKKTIIGTLTTIIAGGGIWLSTFLFGGHEDKKEDVAPVQAQPSIIINNTQQQQQPTGAATKIIERERIIEKPAPVENKKKKEEFKEDPKW